ncbi:MAG: hypothetical protein PHE67_01210 [Campylobacterales bacterium]|nr:hypothetical protein [Campylobacterales bacterium]
MEHLFFQWLKDPTGAVFEFFNRNVFWILWAVLGPIVTYFWVNIKFKARHIWHRIRETKINYNGEAYNGLILSLGNTNELQKMIIDQVKPEFVGIITGNSDAVKLCASELKDFCEHHGIHCDEPHFYAELDVERIEKGYDDIIEWMLGKGIEKKNIVIDLTGGKTPFSLAAFNSARRNNVNAVYTDSEYELNKPKAGTQKSILLTRCPND